jgi:DNA-binding SARP family transcriptional activator/DNA-binding beta-propeller fold protein YncE
MAVVVRVLGPLEVLVEDRPVELGSPQQRTLLALLALNSRSPVKLEQIERVLWQEQPPVSATKVVQTYVSRLRKVLGPDAIQSVAQGYTLDPLVSVDADRFRTLVEHRDYALALALWRGRPVVDLPALEREAHGLEELRVAALEEQFDLALSQGEGPGLVSDLEQLVADYPTHERLLRQLVLALYRSDRQVDALAAYRRGRDRLVDQFGLEPSSSLRDLERRILQQDPALVLAPGSSTDSPAAPTLASSASRRGRRRLYLYGGVCTLVALALAVVVTAIAGGHGNAAIIPIRANMLLRLDPRTNRVVASIPIARDAAALDATPDALWIASERERIVSRIDLKTLQVTTIGEPHPVGFLAHDDNGNIYASGWDYPLVWQINPRTVQPVRSFRVKTRALGLSVGGGSLWVADRLANAVTRIDLASKRVVATIHVGVDPLVSTFGFGSLWVADGDSGTVAVLQPGLAKPLIVRGIPSPYGISAAAGGVWVASNGTHSVYRIDPDTRAIIARINLHTPTDFLTTVSAGPHGVWAIEDHDLVRINPANDTLAASIHFPPGTEPKAVAATPGAVWVTVGNPKDDM